MEECSEWVDDGASFPGASVKATKTARLSLLSGYKWMAIMRACVYSMCSVCVCSVIVIVNSP